MEAAIRPGGFGAATTWRPDQGRHPTTITGILRDVRTVSGSYGHYPLVELEQDDGTVWQFHAFRDVAKSELASCAPQRGDRISIAYGGKSDRGYFLYKVRHADGRRPQVNWSQFHDDAEPVEAGDPPAPAPEGDVLRDQPPF
jgi:hypothetical protein